MDESPTGRQKILLIGGGSITSRIYQRLLALNFAEIELLCYTDSVVHGRGASRVIFDEFGGIRSESVPIRDMYNWKQEAADGIERRKEPKGPRGRWGKL